MSSLNIGNGNWAVKEDNLLGFRYDETEGVFLPREMTFSRACDATRVNPDGLIERVPWNLLQQSNTFSTSPWGLTSSITLTSGQTGYDGSSNAWLLQRTDTSARYVYQNVSFDNNQYTCSVYAKAANNDWLFLYCYTGTGGVNQYYDLANGATGTSGGGFTSSSIESVGNGWYRCTMTFTTPVTIVRIYPAVADGSITGGVSDASLYIQDAQLNEGSTAKDYFPTTNRQDIARIDYSSGTGALLLEPQRTNIATYSEQFNQWSADSSTVTANATTSPDGTQNADAIISLSGTSYGRYQNISISTGVHTFSVYAKANGFNYVKLVFSSSASSDYAVFNLSNGTIAGGTYTNATISEAANGFYRCTITTTINATTGSLYVWMSDGTIARTAGVSGDGVKGIYAWGYQAEAGSYPTSYIPTTSASVTRLADSCYKTGVADWIGQTEGTLFAEFEGIDTSVYTNLIPTISDGTINNSIKVYYDPTSNGIRAFIRTGGSLQTNTTASVTINAGKNKIAVGYKLNDLVVYFNGVSIITDNTITIPATDKINLFDNETGTVIEKIQGNQATIYKTRLSNSELASLTTI